MLRLIIVLLFFAKICYSQEWTDIHLSGSGSRQVWATSELSHPDDDQEDYLSFNKRYGVFNLFDNDPTTAWVEGEKDSGIGVSLFMVVPENLRKIEILNGFGKSKSLFIKNNRIKSLILSCYIGVHPEAFISENGMGYLAKKYEEEFEIELKDTFALQSIEFPFSWDKLDEFRNDVTASYHAEHDIPLVWVNPILQLEIKQVYRGSSWDDTCISQIEFISSYLPSQDYLKYNQVVNIYTDDLNDHRLLIDTPESKGLVFLEDEESIFQLIEASADKQWITLIKMPLNHGEGRTETEWLIINTRLGKIMNQIIERVEKIRLFGPFYIIERDGKTSLQHTGGEVLLN